MIKARDYAIEKHGDQKYAGKPYVFHLDQVAAILKEFGYVSQEMEDAGYLHDVLEDTDVKYLQFYMHWGWVTSELVWAVTGRGKTRAERTQDTLMKLIDFPEAIPLKMADRLANMRFSAKEGRKHIEMYRSELPKYASMFEFTNIKMYEEMKSL